jgi:hypothetical protein
METNFKHQVLEGVYLDAIRNLGLLEYELKATRAQLAAYRGDDMDVTEHTKWILETLLENLKINPYIQNYTETIEHLESAIVSLDNLVYGDVDPYASPDNGDYI